MRKTGATSIVDLCSGAGGPWPELAGKLAGVGAARVLLTDKHPQFPANSCDMNAGCQSPEKNTPQACGYRREPLDVLNLPPDIRGLCTVFSSFHHFEPDLARRLLQGVVRNGMGVCVFEATTRNPISALLLFLLAPFAVLFFTPWVRPFRWARLFWTYCVPAVPVMMGFDGMVSCFRTYTPEEMLNLAASLGDGSYAWESGRIPARGLPTSISYLIGLPLNTRFSHADTPDQA